MRPFVLLCIVLVSVGRTAAARADVIFDFSGTCVAGSIPCLAPALTGELHLLDSFIPGSIVKQSDIISFTTNFLGDFNIGGPSQTAGTNTCGLPASPGCIGQDFGMVNVNHIGYFYTFTDGTWRFDGLNMVSFQGTNATWTPVATPLPASWALLATVLLGYLGVSKVSGRRPAF